MNLHLLIRDVVIRQERIEMCALRVTYESSKCWTDLNLGHDFHEVETLPENDRIRYTISPEARKELLKRLLALNHQRSAEEKDKAPAKAEKAAKGKVGKGKKATSEMPGLFG